MRRPTPTILPPPVDAAPVRVERLVSARAVAAGCRERFDSNVPPRPAYEAATTDAEREAPTVPAPRGE